MPENSVIRQRKNPKRDKTTKKSDESSATDGSKKKKNKKNVGTTATTATTTYAGPPTEEETLTSVFFSHPLVKMAQIIVLPYLILRGLNYVSLKRPEWVNRSTGGFIQLRPAVGTTEERQVLIIGASIADNKIVSRELVSTLRLEVAHETFDTQNDYCRDGTTSWFQIMRFVGLAGMDGVDRDDVVDTTTTTTTTSTIRRLDAFKELCVDRNSTIAKEFHPKLYTPSQCSSYENWSKCWTKECLDTIKTSLECATRKDDGSSTTTDEGDGLNEGRTGSQCSPTFRRILHLTRHPLVTIENFNSTVCASTKLQTNFFTVIGGFFPHRQWENMSCLEGISWYTYDFESTMLMARKDHHLVDGMFPIESTSPCDVVSMAGFMDDRSRAVDDRTAARLSKACHGPIDDENTIIKDNDNNKKDERANSPDIFVPKPSKKTTDSKIVTSVTWADLESELDGNKILVQLLKSLTHDLGYGVGPMERKATSEFI